jgi:hypothetical protein
MAAKYEAQRQKTVETTKQIADGFEAAGDVLASTNPAFAAQSVITGKSAMGKDLSTTDRAMEAAGLLLPLIKAGRWLKGLFRFGNKADDLVRVATKARRTKLYRAVSEAEFKSIMKSGKFEAGSNSLLGKFFAESAEDAGKWGEIMEGKGKFRIIETELPNDVADELMRWEKLDGIGPARYAELEQLQEATIRELK